MAVPAVGEEAAESEAQPENSLPAGLDPSQVPTAADASQAFEEQRQREEAQLEWLASPEAQGEREASATAFADYGRTEAADLLAREFAPVLAELDADPARVVSDLQVEQLIGTHAAEVAGPDGDVELIESTMPLGDEVLGGAPQPIDLELERIGGEFQPEESNADLALPADAAEAIDVGEVSVQLPGAAGAIASRFGDKDLFYPETDLDTDTLVAPTGDGVEIFSQLRSPESPTELRFPLGIPAGASLQPDGAGGAVVSDASGVLATVPAPTAVDAQGAPVAVQLSIDGSALLVTAEPEGEVAYPILVDPEVKDNWWDWSWFNGNPYGLNSGQWGWSWGNVASDGYFYGWSCSAPDCSGRGGLSLRARGSSYYYNANSYGQLLHQAPGGTAYFERGIFGPNYGNVNNCPGNQPHGWVGLYNVNSGVYNSIGTYSPLSFSNNTFDTNWVGGVGTRLAVAGIGTGGSPSQLACGKEFYVGGVVLWLNDPDAPVVQSAGGPGVPVGNEKTAINIHATDGGLGVSEAKIEAKSSSGQTLTWLGGVGANGCGPSENKCPTDWYGSLTIEPNFLPSGSVPLTVKVKDPQLHWSGGYTATLTVDHIAPTTTITGGPPEGGTSATQTPTFTYQANEANATFKCKIDTGAFETCPTAGYKTPTLALGVEHTFQVRGIDSLKNEASTATVRHFYVGAPDTVIDSGPVGPTNDPTPTFAFHATQQASLFECRIDAGTYAPCLSEHTTPELAQGSHVFYVRAVNTGVIDPSPASRTFTVDLTPPKPTVTMGPSGPTNAIKPTFGFSTEAGVTSTCSIDTGTVGYGACSQATSHTPTTALPEQVYTFRVKESDPAGNEAVAKRVFSVDTTQPETEIESGPDSLTNNPEPPFDFDSNEDGAKFECRIDSGTKELCEKRNFQPEELSDGQHTLYATAIDQAGNVDTTPATEAFAVDTTLPAISITGGPGSSTNATTPTFTFSTGGSTVQCALDPESPEPEEPSFRGCSGASSDQQSTPLGEGRYAFRIRAVDAAGNTNVAVRRFSVDTAPPDTSIMIGPDGPTDDPEPFIVFTANELRTKFECRMDGGSFRACTGPGPIEITSSPLPQGPHTFQVRAVDAAGSADPTPATRAFTVDLTKPQTTIQTGPSGPVASVASTFGYTASESGATYECRIDEAAFAKCPNGSMTTPSLPEGLHTVKVRAVDAASNADPTPAQRNIVVDTSKPSMPEVGGALRDSGTTGVTLEVETKDGNAGAPTTIRSGVKTLRVAIDGATVYQDQMPCADAYNTCRDSLSRELELPYQNVIGTHTYRIETADALGHTGQVYEWQKFIESDGTIFARVPDQGGKTCDPAVERTYGRPKPGVIVGTNGADLIVADNGTDVIYGEGGCDVIIGRTGSETMLGGSGRDLIRGERGNDKIYGDDGSDLLYGGIGDDRLEGRDEDDRLDGGPGTDDISGDGGDDAIRAGQGIDTMHGGGGEEDVLSFADGTTPAGYANDAGMNFTNESTDVGPHIDMTAGEAWNGELDGGGGLDHFDGFERVVGSPFSDVIIGAPWIKSIESSAGADIVRSGGTPEINGGSGGDHLNGENVARLIGDITDRCINGAAGSSDCGSGQEAIAPRNRQEIEVGFQDPTSRDPVQNFYFAGTDGDDVATVTNFPGADKIQFKIWSGAKINVNGCGTAAGGAGEILVNCKLEDRPLGAVVMWGARGDDTLRDTEFNPEQPGAVELLGGPDDDHLYGWRLGELLVDGYEQGTDMEELHGAGGDDGLLQGKGSDFVEGGQGNDLIISSEICQRDKIYGDRKDAAPDANEGRNNGQFHPLPYPVFANLSNGHLGKNQNENGVCYNEKPYYDVVEQIDDLEATKGADKLIGNGSRNLLIGRGKYGKDILRGEGNRDTLHAKNTIVDQVVSCGPGEDERAWVDNGEEEKDAKAAGCERPSTGGPKAFPSVASVGALVPFSEDSPETTVAAEPVESEPAATGEYPLNESAGATVDNLVEGGEDGSYEEAPVGPQEGGPALDVDGAFTDPDQDAGAELDGVNDYVELGAGGEPSEDAEEEAFEGRSIELWVQFEGLPSEKEYLYSQMEDEEGAYLYRSAAGNIVFGTHLPTGSPEVETSEPVNDEQWHHLLGVINVDGIELYVDGFPYRLGYGQDVVPDTIENDEASAVIGASSELDDFLEGTIDEIVTYDGVVSEGEVAEHVANSEAEEPEVMLIEPVDQTDSDGDGTPDVEDNCAGTSNSDQLDADSDGVGDACMPLDGDGDGVADEDDNCVEVFNSDQADHDEDGIGGACDEAEPIVTTKDATDVKANSATLRARVNPEGSATTYYFQYGRFGFTSQVPVTPVDIGSGTENVFVSQPISGLTQNAVYRYRIVANNAAEGVAYGEEKIFTTPRLPAISKDAATVQSPTAATLQAVINPEGLAAEYQFEYGKTTAYGSTAPMTPQQLGSGAAGVSVNRALSGLEPSTTYHFRANATSSAGTKLGEDRVFYTGQWSQQSTHTPAPPVANSKLDAVSCAGASACFAVGYNSQASQGIGQVWNGGEWKSVFNNADTPQGVACTLATSCLVVGTKSSGGAFASRWTEASGYWFQQTYTLPLPEGATQAKLNDVSCYSATFCMAVGSYYNGTRTLPLAERFNGEAWTLQSTANPETGNAELFGVSCPTSEICLAVGKAGTATFAERFKGTAWSITATPTPEGEISEIALRDVSCTSGTACTSAGAYFSGKSGTYRLPLLQRWNGVSWTAQAAAAPPADAKGNVEFSDVACTSATSCIAVGEYATENEILWIPKASKTLVQSWNGVEWSLQTAPNGEGKIANRLSGIFCSSIEACVAVGSTRSGYSSGESRTFGVRWG